MSNVLIVYRKSKSAIIQRLPARLMGVDANGRVHGEANLYLVLGAESDKSAVAEWVKRAKTASAAARVKLADELEPRGLKIARMGDNGDAVVMWDDDFSATEWAKAHEARCAEESARRDRTVKIYLSSRGWGDYPGVEWMGDITRPDAEIARECRRLLDRATDVDRNLTDDEIVAEIAKARAEYNAKIAKREDYDRHVADCKRRARETGARVEIRHYATKCHDPKEECSLDIEYVWANPDGTITTTWEHTW